MKRQTISAGIVLALILSLLAVSPTGRVSASHTVPVTITITRVIGIGDDLDGIGRDGPDFYAGASIAGGPLDAGNSFATHQDDQNDVSPFWTISRDVVVVDDSLPAASVTLSIWDHDECTHPFCTDTGVFESDDDQLDIMPGPGETIALTINLNTGKWTGDVNWPTNCIQGDGGEAVKVCFDISILSASGDADGDGLLDGWESLGLDADGNGTIDVNLPAFGANPRHKDLFLELDSVAGQTPTRAAIQAIKAAFAAAPLSAGSTASTLVAPNGGAGINAPPNPDGLPGINLWVDTGNLTDPTASEDGAGPNSCSDGIDNGGGDGADATDPDCLVGDNLGGGNIVPRVGCLDSAFYTAKAAAANFNPNRRLIFRYAIDGNPADSSPCGGGRGEIGGNDFVEFNHDGGTIMHEFGHTLNLHHGGNVDNNCKPNYVSVMNYDNQFGINQAGGGTIIDYSPPRFAGGRGAAPLGNLVENNLDEATILDATDATNRFVFVDANGRKIQNQLNQREDWNADGDTNDSPPPPIVVNIDTSGLNGRPARCTNSANNSTLTGFHDWNAISLTFRQFGDSASGAVNPVPDPEPTLQELLQLREELNTTDVAITMSDSPDPAVAGDKLKYSLTVKNNGPNPASQVQVVDTLPAGVTYQSDDGGCVQAPALTLTCNLGELLAGQSKVINITVLIDADLVYKAGGPTTITNQATVDNLAGPDPNASNDSASETTRVVAVADLAIVSFAPLTPPKEILVNQDVNITMRKVITNLGPSAPMDVKLTKTATAPADSTVTPTAATENALAVKLNEQRVVDEVFTIHCNGASMHTFTFTNDIRPLSPDDTDPNLANNHAEAKLEVTCVVPVTINIKPGENPNSINLKGDSSIAVAVLTTKAGEYGNPLAFDATTIDPLSVRFGPRSLVLPGLGGASEIHKTGHLEDSLELDEKTKDGDLDMVLHFAVSETGIVVGDTEACVKGEWIDAAGTRHKFFGCDAIRVIK